VDGKRVLVVGASSGLGRGIGVALGQAGAHVALAGRRLDRLTDAAAEAGPDAATIGCDVCDPADCEAVVATAIDSLGGLDALVYCPGVSHLGPLADAGAELWHRTLDTNLIGAALVTRAAIPELTKSAGRVIYLTSDSSYDTPPWPGLGPYIVSKAAMSKLLDVWRAEHPEVAFTRIVVGPTSGEGKNTTEFANDWDPDAAGEFLTGWITRGFMNGNLVALADLTDQIISVLSSGADLTTIVVRPR